MVAWKKNYLLSDWHYITQQELTFHKPTSQPYITFPAEYQFVFEFEIQDTDLFQTLETWNSKVISFGIWKKTVLIQISELWHDQLMIRHKRDTWQAKNFSSDLEPKQSFSYFLATVQLSTRIAWQVWSVRCHFKIHLTLIVWSGKDGNSSTWSWSRPQHIRILTNLFLIFRSVVFVRFCPHIKDINLNIAKRYYFIFYQCYLIWCQRFISQIQKRCRVRFCVHHWF